MKNLNLENVLIFDIETASRYKDVEKENPEMLELFRYKRRNREDGSLISKEEAIEMYNREAALSAVYGQIICITIGAWKDNEFLTYTFKGDEKEIIERFVRQVMSRRFTLVGYNLSFDIPYIRKRALHHGITDYLKEGRGLDVGVKPWVFQETVIDLMQIMKGIGWANESLEETCFLLGVPSSKKGECAGAEVSKFFHSGRIDDIVAYCEEDVRATAEVFLKLRNF